MNDFRCSDVRRNGDASIEPCPAKANKNKE